MGKLIDLTGQRFGRLTVLERAGRSKNESLWLCRCDCGNEVVTWSSSLRRGLTRSCGCIASERMTQRHREAGETIIEGSDRSKLYWVWRGMIRRCHDPKSVNYQNYGARGIAVCAEWRSSYRLFRDWALGHGYSEGLTIDRIDNSGNYSPDNCQWLTRSENSAKRWADSREQ